MTTASAACSALVAALLGLAPAVSAADTPPAAASREAAPIAAEVVKPGLYRVGGALVRLGATGVVVVDPSRAGTQRPLMAQIRGLAESSDAAVGALVLTAAQPGPAGSIGEFAAAGVPVIVQKQAVARLALTSSDAATHGPLVTYGTDYQLRVGDVEAEIEHVGRGRTGADSVVYFPDLRVVAVGDLFTQGTPQPECASGGTLAGWAAAIAHVLWFDFDLAVPSRGPAVGKPELRAFGARLQALADGAPSPSVGAGCEPSR